MVCPSFSYLNYLLSAINLNCAHITHDIHMPKITLAEDLMDLTRVMGPGSTDARPDSARGLTAGEVVHHAAKRARVRIDGTINGKSFTVERTAGR